MVSTPQAQAATVTLKLPMTFPAKTVSPTCSVAPSGPSRPPWPEDIRDGLDLQETLHNRPQSLRIILKKYANSVKGYNTFFAKAKYPLPCDVQNAARDAVERVTDFQIIANRSTHPEAYSLVQLATVIRQNLGLKHIFDQD